MQKVTGSILRFGMYIAKHRMGIPKFRISIRYFSFVRPVPSPQFSGNRCQPRRGKGYGRHPTDTMNDHRGCAGNTHAGHIQKKERPTINGETPPYHKY